MCGPPGGDESLLIAFTEAQLRRILLASLFSLQVNWYLGWLVLDENGKVASRRLEKTSDFTPQHLCSNFFHHLYSDCQHQSLAVGGV